mgnify:CR=1 FL=1
MIIVEDENDADKFKDYVVENAGDAVADAAEPPVAAAPVPTPAAVDPFIR